VDDGFSARPKGAYQMIQYGVTTLEKGPAIPCGLCLVLDHLVCSELINPRWLEYKFHDRCLLLADTERVESDHHA